jgi:hypothetical protein
VIALFFLKGIFMRLSHDRADQEGRKRIQTYNGMVSVSASIESMACFTGKEVPTAMPPLIEALRAYDHGIIEWLKRHVDPEIENGVYHDAWGSPIKLVVTSPREYAFISFGPNLKDDGRQGDDIVYSFNPLEIVEQQLQNKGNPDGYR